MPCGNEISINQLYETLQSVSDKNIEAIANFFNTILIILALIGSCSRECSDLFISGRACVFSAEKYVVQWIYIMYILLVQNRYMSGF